MKFPEILEVEKSYNIHDKIITDKFAWLENIKSEQVNNFIEIQNQFTKKYFDKIEIKNKVKDKLKQMWNYPKYSAPFKRGNNYYYFFNSGLQNQSVLMRQKNLNDIPEIFIDPNTFSNDSTSSLSSLSFSPCGKYLAYSIANAGSQWSDIIVIDIETKDEITQSIKDILFDDGAGYHKVVWDNKGFYYAKFDDTNEDIKAKKYCKLYYRKLFTNEPDKLIYEDKENPLVVYGISITKDKRFLCLYPNFGNHLNKVIVFDLQNNYESKIFIDTFENESQIISSNQNFLYMITNRKAPNKKIIKINWENFEEENWQTIIEEKDYVLEDTIVCDNLIVCQYLKIVSSKIKIYSLSGEYQNDIELPSLGSVYNLSYDKNQKDLYLSFTSFSYPNEILKYNFENKSLQTFKKSQVDFIPSDYITKQIWYESYDKTKIPMFLTHKKELELNEQTPTLLYGYGGFNINITPFFSIANAILLQQGFVIAIPNLRGGGEFGEEWHKQGILEKKQNVFDDFIAAAEFLLENKLTSKEKLCIMGGSNGGLLVGACLVQRPELFKCAVPVVGVLDMINFHKYGCGMDWMADYGNPDKKEDFEFLIKYSPYHNAKENNYPSTLIMTSSNDDNVVPYHSYKFAAILQKHQLAEKPILLRVETKSGHQGGSSTEKRIEELTDRLTFILKELDAQFK